ncbi:hypothetical protein, partial [Enterobacter hormaechei]|uniref:hypothetical protein n=1 Tax=Enterobacter hormaechei TaxID=158836 RepID=UPI002876934A|nr:hypothetical protein [Enterobacter hormaechei subsp. steigerwaltii]
MWGKLWGARTVLKFLFFFVFFLLGFILGLTLVSIVFNNGQTLALFGATGGGIKKLVFFVFGLP